MRMPLFDMPRADLLTYRPDIPEPEDFDAFWQRTLTEAGAHPLDMRVTEHPGPLTMVDVYDVGFAGWGGDPVNAWLIAPANTARTGCVITYIGYHGGRGFPHQHLRWAAAGWANLV